MIVPALKRAEFRKQPQMPLSNQRSTVAGLLEKRRQRGMFGWKADIAASQWLLQPDWQPVLVAAGDKRSASSGTNRGVGVSLQEPDAVSGQAIDVWRADIGPPVARDVGVPEIVSHDEDDVRRC